MTTPPLQPGQYWRTRAGDIRYVASIMPEWARFPFPVQVISRAITGQHRSEWYRLSGEWQNSGESSHDLVTHLPDCDSLDWAPATIEYPAYVMPASGDFHYAYIRRDSATSAEVVYRSGHVEPYSWTWESQGFIDKGSMIYITKEQAESRVQRPAPPESPEDWVDITDPEHVFRECDELSCCDSEFTSPVIWLGKKVGAFLNSPGQCHSYKVRCRRKDLPPVADPPKPPSHHTAPEVWSLIEDADRENFCTYQEQRPSFTPIQLLIRICSAQQSMLSELSAQVDALRSEITNRECCCEVAFEFEPEEGE